MTCVAGYVQYTVPCCGKVYVRPNYRSMNFMAHGHWTDGWREASLMPNDTGLRHCQCGHFLLIRDTEFLGVLETAEAFPPLPCADPHQLEQCIACTTSPAIEIAARTELWWHHNHPYRQSYRAHRAAEEQATRQAWEAAHPDPRTWWDKFRGKAAPQYQRPRHAPFTIPPCVPTNEQLQNMQRLCMLLEQEVPEHSALPALTLAELYRQQSLWAPAQATLDKVNAKERQHPPFALIQHMLQTQTAAPCRYQA